MSAISDAANAALVVEPTPAAPAAPAAAPAATPPPATTPAAAPAAPAEPSPAQTAPTTPSAAEKARAAIEGVLGDKPPSKKGAPATPEDDKIEGFTDEEVKAAKSNPKAWGVVRSLEKKRNELKAEISSLKAAPKSAANDAEIASLKRELEAAKSASEEAKAAREEAKLIKQRLAERDYRETDEYQRDYVKPFQNSFLKAREFTSRLQVLPKINPETQEQTSAARQATPADFDKVFNAGPQERYAIAKELFGPDIAVGIVRRAEDLDGLNEKAIEAISSHASNYEKIHTEREGATKKEQETFSRLKDENRKALEEKYAEYFSPEFHVEQPELQKALQDGYAQYDDMAASYAKASPEDRAANEVVMRAYYAAFPMMFRQNTALKSQVASLQEELKKYQSSDPGSITPGTAAAPDSSGPVGIAENVKIYQPR